MDNDKKSNIFLQIVLMGDDPQEHVILSILLLSVVRGGYFLFLIGILVATHYYPWRIWQTGSFQQQQVIDVKCHEGNREVAPWCNIITAGSDYTYKTGGGTSIKPGDTIPVFYSQIVDRGVMTETQHPSLFHVLLKYDDGGGSPIFIIPFTIMMILVGLFLFVREIRRIVKKIYTDTKEEVQKSSQPKSLLLASIKGYVTFFANISFSYALTIVLIDAILKIERAGAVLVGLTLFFGILVIVTAPIIIYRLKISVKEITNKKLAYSIQTLSFIVSLYGTFIVFRYINKYPLTESHNIAKWISDLLKSFLP